VELLTGHSSLEGIACLHELLSGDLNEFGDGFHYEVAAAAAATVVVAFLLDVAKKREREKMSAKALREFLREE